MHQRGRLTVINTVCVSSGQLIANVVDALFASVPQGWRYMFAVSALPAFVQFIGFFFLPESPRYLMGRGRETEARAVLEGVRAPGYPVETELDQIRKASVAKQGGLRELLSQKHLRKILLLAMMMQAINQLVGINTIMYYNATILKLAGINSNVDAMWIAAGINVVFVAFTVVGLLLTERAGRRALMLWSLALLAVSTLVLAQAFWLADANSPISTNTGSPGTCGQASRCAPCLASGCGFCATANKTAGTCLPPSTRLAECAMEDWYLVDAPMNRAISDVCPDSYSWLAILALCMYLASFSFGVTSMPWVINAEIFPNHLRTAGTSYATSTNWICNLGVSLTFLTLTEAITKAGTFWLYAGVCVLSFFYCYWQLPETRGLSLEAIEDIFVRRCGHGYAPLRPTGDGGGGGAAATAGAERGKGGESGQEEEGGESQGLMDGVGEDSAKKSARNRAKPYTQGRFRGGGRIEADRELRQPLTAEV